uniref:uncharacterized protein LOC122604455 n=1 Tax=Erigeron canadensis TaxID=72917 RepID=UPI001CB95FFE|nr:uncharacterized protein LOC122604455 [Erigeron canadensis]
MFFYTNINNTTTRVQSFGLHLKLNGTLIKAIHDKKRSWGCLPIDNQSSGVWRKIVRCIESIEYNNMGIHQLLNGVCGDGADIRFWLDIWEGDSSLKDGFPRLFRLKKDKKCSIKNRLRMTDSGFDWSWNWSRGIQQGEELNKFNLMYNSIADKRLGEGMDRWIWIGNTSNMFTVKAVKNGMITGQNLSDRYILQWASWVPKKINIFMWQMVMDRIPTADALKVRNSVINDDICVLCDESLESTSHMFCSCGVASLIWYKISTWCKAFPFFVFTTKDLVEIHNHVQIGKKERKALKGIIMIPCWFIWKERNDKKFANNNVVVESIFQNTRSMGYLWYRNRKKNVSISWKEWCRFELM